MEKELLSYMMFFNSKLFFWYKYIFHLICEYRRFRNLLILVMDLISLLNYKCLMFRRLGYLFYWWRFWRGEKLYLWFINKSLVNLLYLLYSHLLCLKNLYTLSIFLISFIFIISFYLSSFLWLIIIWWWNYIISVCCFRSRNFLKICSFLI
jgi:hypothetical protein